MALKILNNWDKLEFLVIKLKEKLLEIFGHHPNF